MSNIHDKVKDIVLAWMLDMVLTWCWNQARSQEMRSKFEELRRWAQSAVQQQANTANLRVQRLLRQLLELARQGKQLLDGEPTTLNLSNAKERFEKIRVVALELKNLLPVNVREPSALLDGVHLEVKKPQFNPRYLHRRTRFRVIQKH